MNEIGQLHVDVTNSLPAWQEVEIGTNFCPDTLAQDSCAAQQLVKALRFAWRQTVRKRRSVRCLDKKDARAIAGDKSGPVGCARRLALSAAPRRYAAVARDIPAPSADRRSPTTQYSAPHR